MICFVEHLTWRAWIGHILPRLVAARFRTGENSSCYFIDHSPAVSTVARATALLGRATVEPLQFRMLDVRDEAGLLVRLRIASQDLRDVQREVLGHTGFAAAQEQPLAKSRLPLYLAKSLAANFLAPDSMIRALFVIQVCRWSLRRAGAPDAGTLLFMVKRPWLPALGRYAAGYGVALQPVPGPVRFRDAARRILGPRGVRLVKTVRNLGPQAPRPAESFASPDGPTTRSSASPSPPRTAGAPRLGVNVMEALHFEFPERQSEAFFRWGSPLADADLLIVTHVPLDREDDEALARRRVAAVATTPQTASAAAPLFISSRRPTFELPAHADGDGMAESAWIRRHVAEYRASRGYWSELFARFDVKVFVTWYRYDASIAAIADAIRDQGGIAAVYQRAYQPEPAPEIATHADIMFGYAPMDAEVERQSGSTLTYHVAAGYLGDYRFPLVRSHAAELRTTLQAAGAKRIIAFFDENSADDPRWHTGHDLQREHYAFLLEKILREPWVGLLVKPKVPRTLRRRLGPVADLLTRAEATGRCHVLAPDGGRGGAPPVLAALAADVAIHGHLCAGTAAVEAALAGVPTLLLDREGWSVSPLYGLPLGRVPFTDWPALWNTLLEHWRRPGGVPGFGDWSLLLDEIDPFRDGRASERVGTYLHWLLEGLKAGGDRDAVMREAAERYAARWGRDKVREFRSVA